MQYFELWRCFYSNSECGYGDYVWPTLFTKFSIIFWHNYSWISSITSGISVSKMVWWSLSYNFPFRKPQREKSNGVESDDLGGQFTYSLRPGNSSAITALFRVKRHPHPFHPIYATKSWLTVAITKTIEGNCIADLIFEETQASNTVSSKSTSNSYSSWTHCCVDFRSPKFDSFVKFKIRLVIENDLLTPLPNGRMTAASHGLLASDVASVESSQRVNASLQTKFVAKNLLRYLIVENDDESKWMEDGLHFHRLRPLLTFCYDAWWWPENVRHYLTISGKFYHFGSEFSQFLSMI